MQTFLSTLTTSFILGLFTPTTAVCVLPLYPGFVAYLSNKVASENPSRKIFIFLGLIITAGVIFFMFLLGLIFTAILQVSLTNVIGLISPIAFSILAIISILLIFNVDLSRFIPKIKTPTAKNPYWGSFFFGFFFGAIVIPCNPLFIAAFFSQALSTAGPVSNIISFLAFGLGIGFPLIILSALSGVASRRIIGFLVRYKRIINLLAGLAMLIISVYYLFFVFKILG